MPITKVLDAEGAVLHDCVEAGCVTSWDGYRLVDDEDGAAGTLVEGAEPLNERWKVLEDGTTAQAVERS